jgi:hypothetical protein
MGGVTNMQLYRRIEQGKRVRYEPVGEAEKEPIVVNLTDGQYLTIAGSLAVTLLMLMERFIPEHKRNHRKIKAVREAVHDLYAGAGQSIDDATCGWILECWDRAMALAENTPESA